jgi:hypothetical protein
LGTISPIRATYHPKRDAVAPSQRVVVDQRELVERAQRGDHEAFAALAGA